MYSAVGSSPGKKNNMLLQAYKRNYMCKCSEVVYLLTQSVILYNAIVTQVIHINYRMGSRAVQFM